MNTIGIIQGRLTLPHTGELQCFPADHWQKEFELAENCGFHAIELIFEKQKNTGNPLWTSKGIDELKRLSDKHHIIIPSVCADYFMSNPLTVSRLERNSDTLVVLSFLLKQCEALNVKSLVIPFFESGEITSETHIKYLVQNLVAIQKEIECANVKIVLETSLPGKAMKSLMERLENVPSGICYDTGNTTAFGHQVGSDIQLLSSYIVHVHIKDRQKNGGPNVFLGTGGTDFKDAFRALRTIGYDGPMILETVRGNDPIATAKQHLQFVQDGIKRQAGVA
ncbi:MAG: hypothetical protein COV74_09285 [Candidatus Omnitrophica bacterium CG11_big_fil_rev_8_21_14_0_20_45_26]|uniref:Xylose isomerase-like TIM barrel domain-containing protein n=1 Tax=Candidatus Abzuiibacterium crystallinum TaxID=1974748 RepID=A0A2H0LLU1_9BACT|nr:MAG: hypothetical protein COV74_09285 [Candidatus Omnitrophica bacterium CG11_big_fil_rev_8_21_14_0_20_45_26]PIW63264.1 MAG: hypothetical protein COW12_11260 [Candidatus Omnitrophica bacterium CG12_big_fil_rev_8_21_14_0_65_45_16]